MSLFQKKAQSTAEYAILIGLVISVLVLMQTPVKRAINSRFKDTTDKYVTDLTADSNWGTVTENVSGATTVTNDSNAYGQWEYGKQQSTRTREILAGTTTTETMETGGKVTRDITEKTQQGAGDHTTIDY